MNILSHRCKVCGFVTKFYSLQPPADFKCFLCRSKLSPDEVNKLIKKFIEMEKEDNINVWSLPFSKKDLWDAES